MREISSQRVKYISKVACEKQYQRVWDLCCDHGHIGLEISDILKDTSINFVDCIDSIINTLKDKFSYNPLYKFLKLDAREICVESSNELVVVAGVGGELTIQILNKLSTNHPSLNFDILISPHNNIVKVKDYLYENLFSLDSISIVIDGSWSYEVLRLSRGNFKDKRFFDLGFIDIEKHLKYIQKTLKHNKNIGHESKILAAYVELI